MDEKGFLSAEGKGKEMKLRKHARRGRGSACNQKGAFGGPTKKARLEVQKKQK